MNQETTKMDLFIKILLTFAALYFLGHIAHALADPPIIRCITTRNGTVTCFPI